MTVSLAESFGRAVAAKDNGRVRELLHPQLDFCGMTPSKIWDASSPEDVVETLNQWFSSSDEIVSIEALEVSSFADRERVGYRLLIRNDNGEHLLEQQAYLTEREGLIGWLRIMCSGYRLVD